MHTDLHTAEAEVFYRMLYMSMNMCTGKRVRCTKSSREKISRYCTIHARQPYAYTIGSLSMWHTGVRSYAVAYVCAFGALHMCLCVDSTIFRALHHIFFFTRWPMVNDFYMWVQLHDYLLLLCSAISSICVLFVWKLPRCTVNLVNFVFSSCCTVCQNQWNITVKQNVRRILCVFFHQKNV